jgi:hypothetical protein
MRKISGLFRTTRSRIVGAAVGAALVAALAVGVSPYATDEVVGQTPPPAQITVDVDFDEETGCFRIVILSGSSVLFSREICFPIFRFS